MQKVDLNMHAFQNRNWCSLKSDHCFFFLWLSRELFILRILIERKYEGTELLSEKKTEALYSELKKRAEGATSSCSATGDFLQYIYSVFVAKNGQKVGSACLVHELFFTDIFQPY